MEHIGRYLRDIYFGKKRGQLTFKHQEIQKYLYFQDGNLVFTKTNQPDELLGEVLFRLGKISQEAHQNIEEYIEPMEIIGQVLVKRGLISEQDLLDGLIYQMREVTLNIFPIFNGVFKFQERDELSMEDLDARIGIPSLIADGIRRMKFDPNIEKYLRAQKVSPRKKGLDLELTEEEKGVLSKIHPDSSPGDILKFSGLNPDFFWKSLYLFYCLNLIELSQEESVFAAKEKPVEKPISDDQTDKLRDVDAFQDKISGMNFYQILEVSNSASQADIKKAYFVLARKYHPDLFDRNISPSQKEMIDKVFDQITKAYHTLSDEDKRKVYDKELAEEGADDRRGAVKKAEIKFRQAKTLYNQARYEEAMAFLDEAIRLDAHKSSYYLLLAMVETKIPTYLKKAEEHFRKAIRLEPWSPDGYLGLGIMYKNADLKVKAANQFNSALRVDPGNPAALKELKDMEKSKSGFKEVKDLKDLLSFDVKGLKSVFKSDIFGKKKKK
ncbi:MAG: DnaJ domain-containing protein [Candidatus Aminicenantes bacterium]|jgi:curved DNA-binding protein CbpA